MSATRSTRTKDAVKSPSNPPTQAGRKVSAKAPPEVHTVLLLNGPNLGLLGRRQPELYGRTTLAEVEEDLRARCRAAGVAFEAFQHDVEGELVARIGRAFLAHEEGTIPLAGVIFNPGAYTHTSIALRDACALIAGVGVPLVEIHLSNVFAREEFRHHSHISPVALGVVCGFGARGYALALEAVLSHNGGHA